MTHCWHELPNCTALLLTVIVTVIVVDAVIIRQRR